MVSNEMTKLNPIEDKRTYHFKDASFSLDNVTHILVRQSGTHRLKTKDGKFHIVPVGWIHIEIETKNWTI